MYSDTLRLTFFTTIFELFQQFLITSQQPTSFWHVIHVILCMKTDLSASFGTLICLEYRRSLFLLLTYRSKSRKETPQKLTQLSSRFHPRHLVGKRSAQKDITIDTTSDSQMNSNFPNRWSPASVTFNNYFYLFLYLYITWITTNSNAPHLKSPKNQSRRAALGRPAIKITGGLQLVFGRPTLALSSA